MPHVDVPLCFFCCSFLVFLEFIQYSKISAFVLKFSNQEGLVEVTVGVFWFTSLRGNKIFSDINTQVCFVYHMCQKEVLCLSRDV